MEDWTDDFILQAQQSFLGLKDYIAQGFDMGDQDKVINLLENLVTYTEATH